MIKWGELCDAVPIFVFKGAHGGIMKTKLEEKFKILIWWALLLVSLAFGVVVITRLKDRVENAGYSDISKTTKDRLTDVEKDFNYAASILNLLGTDEMKGDEFFKENERRISFVREQLHASVAGIYDGTAKETDMVTVNGLIPNRDYSDLNAGFEKALKRGKTTIVRENILYKNGDVGILQPVKENGKIVGVAFAFYEIENYVKMLSEPVYKDSGYCMLCDVNGNVLIPSETFKAYEGPEDEKIDLRDGEMESLFGEVEEKGTSFREISRKGINFYVYARSLTDYPDYVLITVIGKEAIFEDIAPVTKAIVAIIAMILVVAITQSIYSITSAKRKKNEFSDVLNYDELTGLPTKTHHKGIANGILKKAKGNYAYVACDVSEFKYFNSTFSYEYGNLILKYIANVMSDALLKDETVSRTSGDHFAMLLHYNDPDELTARIMRILDTASVLPITDDGRQPRAVFTCGVYLIGNERDINRIRARANVARKGLKKSITNQIAFYNEADFNNELETHELQEDLLHAISNKELVVFLQPKYGISNEEVIGAEALVRWNHKNKGLLSPNVFIPLAEKIGLVKDIDFYVFASVCKQLNQWKKEGKQIVPVSVNFSRVHLNDDDFVANLIRIAKENEIEPRYLEIELTESAVYDEMERLLDIMYLIKEAGFGLSMDDFGSGYSSLHLLREMPVDVLKLDKGFLDDCGDDNQREKKVISHVISLAKDLQISVLAEGVETESQKNFLQEANCDMIQGYYYAKPMPMTEFEHYITPEEKEK